MKKTYINPEIEVADSIEEIFLYASNAGDVNTDKPADDSKTFNFIGFDSDDNKKDK